MTTTDVDITGLLRAAQGGDRDALDELLPLLYEELRSLARAHRRRWHGDLTMSATAIVHEAYLKLAGQQGVPSESRTHFFSVASKAMRHILCNYARDRRRLKRGAGAEHVALEETREGPLADTSTERLDELAALDAALERLERVNERQSRVVECRFFGAMSIDETATALGLSPATVKRDWTMPRAWLYRELHGA